MSNYEPRHARPAENDPKPLLTPSVRKWLYGIVTALVPLLVVYGVVDDLHAPLWIALAAQVLATSTAYVHTDPPDQKEEP